jgi:hypothetical protein
MPEHGPSFTDLGHEEMHVCTVSTAGALLKRATYERLRTTHGKRFTTVHHLLTEPIWNLTHPRV